MTPDKKKEKRHPLVSPEADPFGSYTGTPEDGGEPVQDADDL